jgi:hypothetical protein
MYVSSVPAMHPAVATAKALKMKNDVSKTTVEEWALERTPGDKRRAANRCPIKPLAPEVARRHQLGKTLLIGFDSRRLQLPSLPVCQ